MIDKSKLKDILLEQIKVKDEFLIERELSNKIKEFKDDDFIIIISGVRRCGKSTLLHQLRTEESYYVNFDDERLIDFEVSDFQVLYELLIELFGEKKIFFFDEIQNVKGWERFVRRLHDSGMKIYVTGSNASMLSKELGTHLTGRHISFTLYPFSFKEFLKFKKFDVKEKLTSKDRSNIKRLFNEYLNEGGFPEYLRTGKKEYLKSVFENIIYRDIIVRYNLKSEKPLMETVLFAASNIGKEISFNEVRKITGLSSATTIKEYFHYLSNSYIAFLIPRFDFSLKKQAYFNKKIYFIDSAMARFVGFRHSEDSGRLLENTVFLALKRENDEIFFYKEKNECDFIIREKGRINRAIQVTQYLKKNNREREINGLIEALKKFKLKQGLILTYDQEEEITIREKKIMIKPVWKWLLTK